MTLLHMTYNITLGFIDGSSDRLLDQHMTFQTNWPEDWITISDYLEQIEKLTISSTPNCIRAAVSMDYSYTLEGPEISES